MHTASSKTLIYWVKPVLPTALHNIESLPVVGPNKLYAPVDSTLVFPGTLCVKKLRSALALTLRDYPHAAGRLSCDPKTQKWRIHLTNDGVPITVGSTNLSYPTDEWFHHNERHPDLLDRLPMSFSASEVGNEPWSQPLVRFKLTIWEKTGETSLSVSASHILGDAATYMRIIHAWSNYYQDHHPVMFPTFERYLDPPPTIERQFVYDTLTQVPQLGVQYTPIKFHEMFNEIQSTTSRVDIKLTFVEIMAIHATTMKSTKVKISTMDSLTAYLVTVLNRTEDVPIRRIANVIDYRGVQSAPGSDYMPPPMTSAGFNIVTVYSKLMPNDRHLSIGSIAEVIREQVARAREPENLRRIVGLEDELCDRTTETGLSHWIFPYEGTVLINNTLKVPLRSQHFGYPGKMRFYAYNAQERCLQIWPANPVKLSDGSWKTYEGGVDINFRVKHAQVGPVMKTIREDMEGMMVGNKGDKHTLVKL